MDIQTILTSLLQIFLIIIPGAILARTKVLNENQCAGLSSVVLNLTWPCLIITSLQMPFSTELLVNSGILLGAMIATMAIAGIVGFALCRLLRTETAITCLIVYMLLFSNTGFMGIPICNALYGSEGVFYAALMDSLSDVFVFTVGALLMKKATGTVIRSNPKELLSPGVFAIVIGIGLFLTNTSLPSVLNDTLGTIGSATTPLAMLIIGFKLGSMSLSQMLGDLRVYAACAMRLLILPAAMLGIAALPGLEMSVLLKVIVLETAMPAATCAVIFAEQYRADTAFTSKGVLLSTLLSVVTIPIFAVLLELL